jgi:hypothetical protein
MRPLTRVELERSERAQKFEGVTPQMLFSATADGKLADTVHRVNPARYRELKQEWAYLSGAERRPDSYYG